MDKRILTAKRMTGINAGHQAGDRIIICATPKGKIYNGLKFGDIVKIIQPPGKFLNTQMSVFIKGLNGKPVDLPFKYWTALPKDAEINVPLYIHNHKEILNRKEYVVPVVPVMPVVKAERGEPVVVRRKVVVNKPIVARRK